MRLVSVLFLLCACSSSSMPLVAAEDALEVVSLAPQSFREGALSAKAPPLAYAFRGTAGEIVAPDVWPATGSALVPTLSLLGPASGGHRRLLASGTPRGASKGHLAIDGFRLPKTGSYLLLVGQPRASPGGAFTLRLWMQHSHAPRQESSQIDLALTPSPRMAQAQLAPPHPLTDAALDELLAELQAQRDPRVALSDARVLLAIAGAAAAAHEASAEEVARARSAAAKAVGSPQAFAALAPKLQAFALWWLGTGDTPLFSTAQLPIPASASDTVTQLISSWHGAVEDTKARTARALILDGQRYGWQVDWSALQRNSQGTDLWIDFASEWFDADGGWLGEESAGASEPEDD